MGLRDKMGVRSRRESGKHFGYFPWGALSWWGNLLHVQGLGILKIGLKMLKRYHKNHFGSNPGGVNSLNCWPPDSAENQHRKNEARAKKEKKDKKEIGDKKK